MAAREEKSSLRSTLVAKRGMLVADSLTAKTSCYQAREAELSAREARLNERERHLTALEQTLAEYNARVTEREIVMATEAREC